MTNSVNFLTWMAYLDFTEFPNLIKYYATIGIGTLLKGEYTTMENCAVHLLLHHHQLKTCQNSMVIMERKMVNLPA